ncbi:MAG TPA: sulfur carrier protein ThiS [Candidatus Gastranaerophilales bacterium]|nr:sulfur carrier protein ThiS [Candidatus Gastranaerophilales bacterium]
MKTIKITVNGGETEIQDGLTIKGLLDSMEIKSKMLVVEKNLEIINKQDYESSRISEGDRLEIVSFCGGG